MSDGLVVAVLVTLGVLSLLAVLKLIYSRVQKKLEALVAEKFADEEMLGATTRANLIGVQSKGAAQIRGNGALVLTRKALCFIRAAPQQEYSIPVGSIRSVSMPRSFLGKSVMVPLLCVHFDAGNGEDAMAWALKDAPKWKETIEVLIN